MRLLGIREVAELLGTSERTIRRQRMRGDHPLFNAKAIQLTGTRTCPLRWEPADVLAYIESLKGR